MDIEIVKNQGQMVTRSISILLQKLANADSKDVAQISKELRHWYKKMPNRGFGPRR